MLIFMVIIYISFISGVYALEVPAYKDKYVNDFAGILSSEQSQQMRNLFATVDLDTTAEIVFVSMNSIEGEAISDFSLKIGKTWGVGKEDKDNGLVMLYVKDMNKIWVSTGYGLEGILPDSKIGRLLDDYYVPARDAGNVGEGISLFSSSIAEVVEQNKEEVISGKAAKKGNDWFFVIFIIIWLLIVITSIKRARNVKRNKGKDDFPWWVLLLMPSRGGSGGGFGGGGFGGGGFGGGGFGGGGAGR